MTVTDQEISSFGGEPVEGFRFIGSFQDYLYTTAESNQTISSFAFTSLIMQRDFLRVGTESSDSLTLQVEMPIETQLIRDHAFNTQPPKLDFELFRSHRSLNMVTEFIIYWKGKVSGFRVGKDTAFVRIPNTLSIMLVGDVPNVWWQNTCNNVLYDTRCKAVRASFDHPTTIVDINGAGMFVASNGGNTNGFFNAGEAVLGNGERRQIARHVGTQIDLVFPFASASNGDSVTLSAGCDLAFNGDCLNVFNNQTNFNGMPYTPTDNPFEGLLS